MHLKVYADESYDDETYCCAAVFGWPADFYYVGLKWETRLAQDGITYFHAYDCQQLTGEFSLENPPGFGYERARKRADGLRYDLTKLIEGEPLLGISLGIATRDFNELVKHSDEARKYFGPDIMIASYKLLIKATVELMENDWPEKRFSNLKIGFVFDLHTEWQKAERAYQLLKGEDPICARRMLTATHDDDKELPGLQMADLVAYECRKQTNEWRKGSPKGREILGSLKKSHNIYFMGSMGKAELLDEMRRSNIALKKN